MILKAVKWILKILGVFLLLIVAYAIAAVVFSSITVNTKFRPATTKAIKIQIITNGVHTDLVLPIKNQYKDWTSFVNPAHTISGSALAQYVAFGWGAEEFYINTPTWNELKISTAFKALFGLSRSAMHVKFYNNIFVDESVRNIYINSESYLRLVHFIVESFKLDSEGFPIQLPGVSFSRHDAFYIANGRFSLFNTCNTWANRGLKAAGLPACLWTPFEHWIFKKYE